MIDDSGEMGKKEGQRIRVEVLGTVTRLCFPIAYDSFG